MKQGVFILTLGLLLAVTAFGGFYYFGTASCRAMMNEPQPGLAWLKKEFKLSDEEFTRISKLHEAYLPQCAQRCARISQLNQKLEQLLGQASSVTPEVRNLLAERATMRADCEAEMLSHFLQVSRMMPPEQGRRYLEWVEQQSCLNGQSMEQTHQAHDSSIHQSHSMADHPM